MPLVRVYPQTDFEWFQACYGAMGDIIVLGELAQWQSARIGATTNEVAVSRPYLQKVRFKHNLSELEIACIKHALTDHLVYPTLVRDNKLTLLFQNNLNLSHYKLGIKSAKDGRELWLETCHRVNRSERKRLEKRWLKK